MSEKYIVVHKKSSVVNNGAPKLPSANTLNYGEIAINYGAGAETLSIKNSNDQIVTFTNDAAVQGAISDIQGDINEINSALTEMEDVFEENELVVSTALNNLNDRLEDVENAGFITGFTETDPTVPSWAKQSSKPSYSASEVGAMATSERNNYLPTGTTLDNVADGSTRKLADYSLTGHTHSDYMTTSERSNYLPTGTTLDNVSDGSTRKLADYSLTSHTHSIYSTTAHTHTAAEVGAMATSERDNYSTTAHTHTASEVGAMATSERNNYLPTGTTLDNVADGSTRKLANYSLTSHTHTANEVGAMATSERGNYLTTATTIPNVDNYFDDVEYDPNSKRINFKHGNTVKDYIDATDFIKDGMVDTVAVSTPTGGTNSGVTCLVVTFNTDAGKSDIEIPLSNIFDASNYYTKDDADEKFMTISAYTEDEEVIAAALNDLDSRIENMYVPHYTSELTNDSGFVTSGETDDIWNAFNNYSTTAHTHDQYSLTSHTHSIYATTAHSHTASEVGAMATSERSNYLPTGTTLDNVADGSTRKLANYSLTSHTHSNYMTTSERGNYLPTGTTLDNVSDGSTRKLSNYSLTSHTHSQYATTAHTHTASEVGAMATSERNNYLPTGTTLDNVSDGATRKLSNYSTTAHTHTAAEVGAMATSERSNYSTTAHTHTANEVGAMATSERSNYLPTGTTLDNVADGSTRKLANYSLTSHTHSDYSLTSHTHSEYVALSSYTEDEEVVARAINDLNARINGIVVPESTSELDNDSGFISSAFTENYYSHTGHTHSQYISGITYNGTAVTVTNGVAQITGSALPTVTSADNGKVMMVVNGAWALVTPTTVYTGSNTPQNSMGNDGDIYLQTE